MFNGHSKMFSVTRRKILRGGGDSGKAPDMKVSIILASCALILVACGNSEPASKASAPESTEVSAPKPASTPSANNDVQLSPEMAHGAKIYKRCRACHTLEQDGKHKVGPNLWGIYGAKTASKDGYAYSKAMRAADIIWDEETMDAYIKRPSTFMPGNKMTFIGLKKQEDRDAVQAYMKAKTSP